MLADSCSVGNLGSCGPFSPGLHGPESSSLIEVLIWPKISSKMVSHIVGEGITFSLDMS